MLYDRGVHRLRVLAAILALTLSASPVVLDRCLISCEVAEASAPHDVSGPVCHRAMGEAGSAPHLSGPRAACGHDHLCSRAVLVVSTHQADRASAAVSALASSAPPRATAAQGSFGSLSPPGAPPPVAAATPLRI